MAVWCGISGRRDFRDAAAWPAPVIPRRARPLRNRPVPAGEVPRQQAEGALLLGVIDQGCPFAHPMLRRAGAMSTRVLAIWDQDPDQPAFTRVGGRQPAQGEGCVITRPDLDLLLPGGEDLAYAQADDDAMRWRYGHGSAVLGLMAGSLPLRPGEPAPDDEASRADVVFVQLARDLIQDSSSAALEPALSSGIEFILAHAGPDTRRIVINISNGTSRGAHDGCSAFDQRVAELVERERQLGRELLVVLPIGNSRQERRHAMLAPRVDELASQVLHLPPASETASFLTVKMPAPPDRVRLRLVPPAVHAQAEEAWVCPGEVAAWHHGPAGTAVAALLWPAGEAGDTALVVLAPTMDHQGNSAVAPHGFWRLEAQLTQAAGEPCLLHVWISRNARNGTALPRAVQARFVDPLQAHDPDRHLRWARLDPPPRPGAKPPLAVIRRASTLNALAAGNAVHVAGGRFRRSTEVAPYSALGPSLGQPALEWLDDALFATDEDWSLRGILARGNRTGELVRVTGTSFAAPQLARRLANERGQP